MEIQGYHLPEDLYYEENHYWIRVQDDHLVMGMDDFARQMAGDIVFVQLPFEGKKLKKGKKFAQVESGKWLGKIFAPVNGVLRESNEELEDSPELVNTDPYGEAWLVRVTIADPGELDGLMDADAYQSYTEGLDE